MKISPSYTIATAAFCLAISSLVPVSALSSGKGKKSKKEDETDEEFLDLFLSGKVFFDEAMMAIGNDEDLTGLVLESPEGVRILDREASRSSARHYHDRHLARQLEDSSDVGGQILFGPTDDCTIGVSAAEGGIFLKDPVGFRLITPDDEPGSLLFGSGSDLGPSRIFADPLGGGLALEDPNGIRIQTNFLNCDNLPIDNNRHGRRLEDCLIEVGARLLFGPEDECRITVNPLASGLPLGLLLEDPSGVRLIDPTDNSPAPLTFGPTDECRILVGPLSSANSLLNGMIFEDPNGFLFRSSDDPTAARIAVTVEGNIMADNIAQTSARRYKTNIRTIRQASEKLRQLRGVTFDWVKEKGGHADVGLIADEVARVFPELVDFQDGAAAGVKYSNIVAVLIQAFKEQSAEIQQLKEVLEEQQRSMDEDRHRWRMLEEDMRNYKQTTISKET